jgi:hypothetical protein
MITKKDLQEAPLRALSWKEPYASLMLHGKIETRTWDTKYRGLVLICASKKAYPIHVVQSISGEQIHKILELMPFIDLSIFYKNPGKAIAVGRLTDCRRMRWEDDNKAFVKYNPNLWCHIYEDVTAIEPFSYKGKQGWSIVPKEIINQIKFK